MQNGSESFGGREDRRGKLFSFGRPGNPCQTNLVRKDALAWPFVWVAAVSGMGLGHNGMGRRSGCLGSAESWSVTACCAVWGGVAQRGFCERDENCRKCKYYQRNPTGKMQKWRVTSGLRLFFGALCEKNEAKTSQIKPKTNPFSGSAKGGENGMENFRIEMQIREWHKVGCCVAVRFERCFAPFQTPSHPMNVLREGRTRTHPESAARLSSGWRFRANHLFRQEAWRLRFLRQPRMFRRLTGIWGLLSFWPQRTSALPRMSRSGIFIPIPRRPAKRLPVRTERRFDL